LKIGGGCAPLGEGKLGPHLPACCQVSSWSVQPFGHNAPTLHTEQDRHRSDSIGQPGFGRPFVKRKRFALSYRTVVCPVLSCLSVCNVGVLWPNGLTIKMKLGMQLGLVHGHIVLDGDQLSLPKGHSPPIFGPCPLRQMVA